MHIPVFKVLLPNTSLKTSSSTAKCHIKHVMSRKSIYLCRSAANQHKELTSNHGHLISRNEKSFSSFKSRSSSSGRSITLPSCPTPMHASPPPTPHVKNIWHTKPIKLIQECLYVNAGKKYSKENKLWKYSQSSDVIFFLSSVIWLVIIC